jgi:hypothetical protein
MRRGYFDALSAAGGVDRRYCPLVLPDDGAVCR